MLVTFEVYLAKTTRALKLVKHASDSWDHFFNKKLYTHSKHNVLHTSYMIHHSFKLEAKVSKREMNLDVVTLLSSQVSQVVP